MEEFEFEDVINEALNLAMSTTKETIKNSILIASEYMKMFLEELSDGITEYAKFRVKLIKEVYDELKKLGFDDKKALQIALVITKESENFATEFLLSIDKTIEGISK